MLAAYLPGNSTIRLAETQRPVPGRPPPSGMHARRWGRVALVGEGGRLMLDVSEALIHRQLTVHGSWVSSTGRMAELLERLDRWGLHPELVVSDTFPLAEASGACELADSGVSGKVGIVWS